MSTVGTQVSFADMGTPLERATFVVVDLETTGGAPGAQALTEIGAVKVRGGQVRFSAHGWSDFCPLREASLCQMP